MRLTHREYWLAAGLVALVAAWAFYAVGVGPALERIDTLNRVIPEKQSELEKLRLKTSEYIALHDSIKDLRTKIALQEETFELLPYAESLVQECGLTKNVVTMKQQTSQLETNYRDGESDTSPDFRLPPEDTIIKSPGKNQNTSYQKESHKHRLAGFRD